MSGFVRPLVRASQPQLLSPLAYMAQGIVVGALIGLPEREQDIVTAEQRGTYWFVVSFFCQSTMIAVIAPLIRFVPDEKPIAHRVGDRRV